MLWSSSETLDLVASHVPDSLVPPEAFFRAKVLTTQLPKAFSSYYFECRLADREPQVDFLACVTALDKGRENFVDQSEREMSPHSFLKNSVWDHIMNFSRQWADVTSPLSEQIPLMWLEFDQIEAPLSEVPLPSFSFCIDPHYMYRHFSSRKVKSRDPHTLCVITEQALQLLYDQALPSNGRELLFHCFEALPAGGQIIHVSSMLGRHPACIKLYGVVPHEHLFPYLNRIGWPGAQAELTDILEGFCTPATVDTDIYIDLTLGETAMPRIGIAFAQQQIDNLSEKDPTRQVLLEECVKNGLCTPEKRDALVTWPGCFRTCFPGERWPTRFHKWLDIKLVYQPDHPLEAKSYLGFMPQFSFF